MPQILPAIGSFFSWVGSLGGGAAAGAGTGAAGAGGVGAAALVAPNAAAAVASSGLISQVANAAFQLALSTAISAVLQPSMAATSGAPLNWKADEQAPVPYLFGETGTGGSVVFKEVYGGQKARHLRNITVLTVGPIEGVSEFRANNVVTTFDGSRRAVGYYNGGMWSDTKLGSPSEVAHVISTPPYTLTESGVWDSDHTLPGLASNQLIMRYAVERYSTGPAEPLFVVQGPPAYDPREDSTVPGGSGSQRGDDRDTWSFASRANPFLQGISWALGIRDQGQVVMGAGMPQWAIDVPAFIEGANVAEANGWTCGGVAYSSDAPFTVLEQLLRAGGGAPIQLGGALSCVVRTPRVSLATLTGADIIGSIDMSSAPSWRDRYNTAFPRYREAEQDWQFVALDPVVVASALAADGGEERRTPEIDLAFVQDKDQAAQLAAYDILDSREAGPWEFEVRPRWRALKPGDCITLDAPELGIESQKLLIRERSRNPMTGRRTLRCWTETDAKHAEALAITGTVPTPAVYEDLGPGIDPPDSGTWTATGGSVTYNGGETPAVFITGTVDSVEAADLLVRYRVDGSGDPWEYAAWPVTADKMAIATVGPVADYEIEYNYRSVRGAVGETWTPDVALATTGDLLPQDDSISTVKIVDEAVTEARDQQVQIGGWGGGGTIPINYQGAGGDTYTQLDEYAFTYGGEGVVRVLWIGCVQWQANSSKTIKTYLCVDGAPSITLGFESGYEIFQTYNGNQNALTSTIAMAANLTGLSVGAHTIEIYGKCDSSSNTPLLDIGAITQFEIGKK
jgi:hypothetical protein